MKALKDYSAGEMARRCALILLIFTVIFSALLATVHQLTRTTIAENIQKERLKIIHHLLPKQAYDNDLLNDFVLLPPAPELGQKNATPLFIARKNGQIRAFLCEAIAPDGFGGAMVILLAVETNGTLLGAQVLAHHETPGLGDYIAQQGESAWIHQFRNQTAQQFKLQKDGGEIAYRAGATISARAVTQAISRAYHFIGQQRLNFMKAADETH